MMMMSFKNEPIIQGEDIATGRVEITAPVPISNHATWRKMKELRIFAGRNPVQTLHDTKAGMARIEIWSEEAHGYLVDEDGLEVCSDLLREFMMEVLPEGGCIEINGHYTPIETKRVESSARYIKKNGDILSDRFRAVRDLTTDEVKPMINEAEIVENMISDLDGATNIVFLDNFRKIVPT